VLSKLTGKSVIIGVLDLSTEEIETPALVASRIRRALPFMTPDRILVAPDCGLKYLPRRVAFEKMRAMVEGTRLVRRELGNIAKYSKG
jgi:5-methyltetrahydropteroyltriglutamate--homocysteine methyltransferase